MTRPWCVVIEQKKPEKGAQIELTAGDIGWAEVVFAMEKRCTERIRSRFRDRLEGRKRVTLFIKDAY